jgi:hypothetical protein
MTLYWLGVFDNLSWRAEYQVVREMERLGIKVRKANYRSPTYIPQDDWMSRRDGVNVVVLQNGKGFRPDWMNAFSDVPVVYWATEASATRSRPILNADRKPDLVIANSMQSFRAAEQRHLPVVRMHNGFDPGLYKRTDIHEQFDIAFLGTLTKRRKWFYRRLCAMLPEARVCLRKRYTPEQGNNIYNASRVIIHVHAIEETYIPSRLFETLPTRGCLLIEEMGKNWDTRIGDRGFVKFNGPNDMCLKALRLLKREKERREIVRRANVEAQRHTWAARVPELISHIGKVSV